MKKNQKYIGLLCCLLCLCVCLSACQNEDPTTVSTQSAKDAIYTVTVKSAGGMVFDGVVAYVYEDDTEDDLLTFGTLSDNGSFTFTAPQSDKYTVRLANLPEEGYDLKAYYAITDTTTEIVLTSSVITGKDALESGKTYQVGDVMRDFTVSTVDGEELTLSQILQEKQAVVLNFWYTGCDPCKREFPLLQSAYEAYSDKIEVITMNPTDISGDDAAKIAQFRDQYGLTMPMAMCSGQWFSALQASAYPTTVIIDRFGVVCLVETGAVDEEGVFEAAFEHFTADDYQQELLEGFSDLHVVEHPVGSEKNPYQANGGMEEFEVTVAGNAEFHVALFRANGIILHVEEPNAYLIVDGERYEPNSKGVIEVDIVNSEVTTPTNLIIGNTGATETTIKVQLLLPQGTFTNPYEGSLGEYTVTVKEGNEQGVYYSWTAPADGLLTVTVTDGPEGKYDIQLYNLNSYAVRNLIDEELTNADGQRYVSVKVSAGDVVSIGYMSVPDENFKYSKVTVTSEISFSEGAEEGPLYSITVKDGDGNPIADVAVNVVVDGVNTVFVSDENGLIAMNLPAGIYTVKVTIPEGYECDTTQFLLTASNPTKELVMTVYVPQEVPYTVYVVDEEGNPVANAAVVLGDSFAYTDAKGMVSVILVESKDYVATIVPPEGYTIDKGDHSFGSETVITVVVKQQTQQQEELDYKVRILDPDGKAYTNLLVRFDSEDGTVSVTESVGADGKVKVRLPKANYTVTLVFTAGNTMGYETTTAKLTPSEPSITVEVAPYLSSTSEDLYTGYTAYELNTGSVYVDLSDTDIRFFLFTPTEKGIYTFTTTNSNAIVGYWGSPSYIFYSSNTDNIKDNVFTVEVKSVGQTLILSISGGEGISGTIAKIERTGDIVETVQEIYEGTTEPTERFVANETGTKTYLNLTVEQSLVKGDDGFYHIGSADGAVVYIDLIAARYGISISALVNNSPMVKYEFNADGKPIKRIDYTTCMLSYVNNADEKLGVYALTDDLITIMQNHGENAGWYDKEGLSYLFGEDAVLEGQGWMFLLCVFQ